MERVNRGADGFALVDVLLAIAILGIGAAAITGLTMNVVAEARTAAIEGRRAALGLGVADRLRAGLLPGDSGIVRMSVDGEAYEVEFVRRDSLAAGSLELSVRRRDAVGSLHFGAARILP